MLSKLEPKIIWRYFFEISAIPRQSKHEEKIIDYLINFAEKRNLKYKQDSAGNIVIIKEPSKGKERSKTVVLQSHIDMVCEKNEGTTHDFLNDSLKLYEEDGFVKAKGTTLGADDGIGVAASLALLDSKDVRHGTLECLFTVDEETGLTGANALEDGFIEGKILLNLDSEEEGAVYIGCAGGKTTSIIKAVKKIAINDKNLSYRVSVEGLKGGHSGLAIDKGRGNALILLARFLWNLNKKINFTLTDFNGGEKHNAIPREAYALIGFSEEELPIFETEIERYSEIYRRELKKNDANVILKKKKIKTVENSLDENEKTRLINMVYSFPHGVYSMSSDIEGLVETSTNLASVTISEDGVNILTSQRSSVESSIHDIAGKVISHVLLAGYECTSKDPYPAWTPNPDSPLLKTAVLVHKKLFSKKPDVKAVHAGLECGILGKKYPGIDMISFGPDVYGAHSPDERVKITSVANFWSFLINLIEEL